MGFGYLTNGRWFASYFPNILFYHPTSNKVVALTIDDSPTENTEKIMEILNQHNTKATFFDIGSYKTDVLTI
jgi:peptidoglycan/xylan/chitin deacetylase (PgdA/CDA1 family)